jgi:hypothetical protein
MRFAGHTGRSIDTLFRHIPATGDKIVLIVGIVSTAHSVSVQLQVLLMLQVPFSWLKVRMKAADRARNGNM